MNPFKGKQSGGGNQPQRANENSCLSQAYKPEDTKDDDTDREKDPPREYLHSEITVQRDWETLESKVIAIKK